MLACPSTVNRLRIRTAERDAATVRMLLARQVESADFLPPGLPPAAIVIIRSVGGPLTTTVARGAASARPDQRLQTILRDRVAMAAREATRPVNGRVDSMANAVQFSDEAELLACAALSLAAPGSPVPWWLRAVARYAHADLEQLLRTHIVLCPAIMDCANRWMRLEDILIGIDEETAASFARAIAEQYRATELLRVLERITTSLPGAQYPPERVQSEEAHEEARATDAVEVKAPPLPSAPLISIRGGRAAAVPERAPWRHYCLAGNTTLAPLQQLLGGVATYARRAPDQLRSPEFCRSVIRWVTSHWQPAPEVPHSPPQQEATPPGHVGSTSTANLSAHSASPQARPSETPSARTEGSDLAASPTSAPDARIEAPGDNCADEQVTELVDCACVETEYGGLLYLINVMEFLHLPECFEPICGLASNVGAFGTLEALASALVPDLRARAVADPIWDVLAALDSRKRAEPPRGSYLDCSNLRFPDEWPLCADTPFEPDALALRHAGWPQPLLTWLEFVMPQIRCRLAQALGSGSPRHLDWLAELVAMPARIYLSPVHIDVVAALDSIRVPLRVSGLDRSPGWVKSLARVVLFHFE
jgi:hypothetical protein